MNACMVCSSPMVVCRFCMGDGCDACAGGEACTQCAGPEALRGAGWSMQTAMVPFKSYRDMIREALDEALLDPKNFQPMKAKSGKINREAWVDGWHIGVEERRLADGTIEFLGLAENEGRGSKCRLPSAMVDEIRKRMCPDAPGKSL